MAEKKADKKKPGFFARIGKYFRDSKGEFKKIVWPSRKQVMNNVVVVLAMVVIFAVATWGLDLLFAFLRDLLLKLF
ncbi:MAG: preprotein translocase subunit SecE [Oscillospiraceae bacterium]|nr:preprotein translocase subunit SecE [Oscillospiraceae bacterium]MBR2740969.1 preprotein translocase subunit SecE [Oscillospiraceae bacterium]